MHYTAIETAGQEFAAFGRYDLVAHLGNQCLWRIGSKKQYGSGVAADDVVPHLALCGVGHVFLIDGLGRDKSDGVDGRERNAEEGVECIDLLHYHLVVGHAGRVDVAVLETLDVVEEEGIEPAIVTIDVEGILHGLCLCGLDADSRQQHCQHIYNNVCGLLHRFMIL